MKKINDTLSVNQEGKDFSSEFQLAEIFEKHRGEKHLVIIHDFPDPDAISSAFAHQLISLHFDIHVDIMYAGKISHQQNIALVKLLKKDLIRYDESVDLKQYDGVVFVDNQGTSAYEISKVVEKAGLPIVMVIDHHDIQEELKTEYSDIRKIGATATIYAQYFENGLLSLDKSIEEHTLIATALMHGVITDTNGFIYAGPEDFHAAAFLSKFRDAELLEQIMSQSRSKRVMEIIYHALGNRIVAENFSISGIGYLRADDRDAIPQAADFLVTEENVHTAIVYGIVQGENWEESVVGSMRTSKLTLDPDEFIKETLGKDASGHYFGGGKYSAGGFQIPIGFLSGGNSEEYLSLKWEAYDTQIKQRIFSKLGVEQEDSNK